MKKGCVLIATLPSLNNMDKVKMVFENPSVKEVRFNTGVRTPYPVKEVLDILNDLSVKYNKKLWIDIKGRQLRVASWADPLYSCVTLNHKVQLEYPAKICFRNGDCVNVTHVKGGNQIFMDPLPKEALGAGQSVNILSKNVCVEGYLTEADKRFLSMCWIIGIKNIMASFVESYDDITQILKYLPDARIVSKIESEKGVQFIASNNIPNLMAARDDLYIQAGQNYKMLKHLKTIIKRDPNAICASRIFSSLEKRDVVDWADFADLELMYTLGYRKFMLCDNICNYKFNEAISAWEEFVYG